MEENNTLKESIEQLIGRESKHDDFSSCEEYRQYQVIRQELNKFLLYINRSNLSTNWHDQVHYLYVALFHLENMEKELYASNLSEDILHNEKITEKLNNLKGLILDTIHDIKADYTL